MGTELETAPVVYKHHDLPWRPKPGCTSTFEEFTHARTTWVTDPRHGLSIAQQLAALGNGVLPRHAEAALRVFLGQIVDQSAPVRE